jgi:tetratricopeptide (TPR) repeat protein
MKRLVLVLCLLSAPALAILPDFRDDSEGAAGAGHIEAGRYELGLAMVDGALQRLPYDSDLLTYRGLALRRLGRIAEAEAAYDLAIRQGPGNTAALAYQGALFLETGRRAAAEANLARLVALCPSGCPARVDLERLLAAR